MRQKTEIGIVEGPVVELYLEEITSAIKKRKIANKRFISKLFV